jgi:DNA helicase HerA-like ATPase
MSSKLGIVFTFNNLPDVSQFPFVISKRNNGNLVRKGLFVSAKSTEGFLIGTIEKIILLNEYFSDALTIKSYNSDENPNILKGLFPSEDFEFAIAIVKCLGVITFSNEKSKTIKKIQRMTYPASPGSEVFLLDEEILSNFIGLDINNGLKLGKIKVSEVEAKINLDRLLNKHFAILSISGGGKSYLNSVIIEELLAREPNQGSPAIVLIDVHGEYTYLKKIPELKEKVFIQDISYFQIAVPRLNAWTFKKYQDQISNVQIRELSKYIQKLKKSDKKSNYSLRDIVDLIEEDTDGNKGTKHALVSWLLELEHLSVFGPQENPIINKLVKPSKITIFNLQNEISIRKKQIIVDYICTRLFYLRRMNKIAPFLLIIEEAHQFVPEAAHSKALSKNIIETIAREGRKFMACLCLISQRPKKLSATALSQCNSKLILNIKNPYDLKHLMDSSEAITKEFGNMISSLNVGEMLLMGNAINYPIFIDVRERIYKSQVEKLSFAKVCSDWQKAPLS